MAPSFTTNENRCHLDWQHRGHYTKGGVREISRAHLDNLCLHGTGNRSPPKSRDCGLVALGTRRELLDTARLAARKLDRPYHLARSHD